mmetsp:Transcript_31375/g.82254  ORF Transcript_31375/g.82254 Transcript_31375/m.82254 type:complete len:317 (-) Transcript_31375:221-1171(-)
MTVALCARLTMYSSESENVRGVAGEMSVIRTSKLIEPPGSTLRSASSTTWSSEWDPGFSCSVTGTSSLFVKSKERVVVDPSHTFPMSTRWLLCSTTCRSSDGDSLRIFGGDAERIRRVEEIGGMSESLGVGGAPIPPVNSNLLTSLRRPLSARACRALRESASSLAYPISWDSFRFVSSGVNAYVGSMLPCDLRLGLSGGSRALGFAVVWIPVTCRPSGAEKSFPLVEVIGVIPNVNRSGCCSLRAVALRPCCRPRCDADLSCLHTPSNSTSVSADLPAAINRSADPNEPIWRGEKVTATARCSVGWSTNLSGSHE